jgi:L-lactate dehydrogenase complex protein LldE
MAKVGLFVPCYVSVLRPGEVEHAERVLRALGDEPEVIDGRCCGQPAFNSGFREEARTVGRELLREARDFDTIVTPSGSCTSMVRHYLPGLYEGAREGAARKLGQRFVEFASYVSRHPGRAQVAFKLSGVVAYHDSCHARRELGLTDTVTSLLEEIEGLDVRRLRYEEECCGFGGTFSLKLPEVAGGMVGGKLDDVMATGARVLVSTDLSCLGHIESMARGRATPLETWSVAELLAKALP